jgi:hypothetical protein
VDTCPVCGNSFEADRCPFCEATAKATLAFIRISSLMSLAGFAGGMVLFTRFPLLEWPLATTVITLALFFAPFVFLILLTFNRPFVRQAARIKRVFGWMAALLIVYVAFCFLNVGLDTQPPIEVPVRVVSTESGRASRLGGTVYLLRLSVPWHQQQVGAEVSVSPQKFSEVEPGDLVYLVVHPGAFSLAWRREVLP